MSLPRYEQYKDSGVPWLGDIPTGWAAKPIKYLGQLKGGAGFPQAEQGIDGEKLGFHKVNALGRASSTGVIGPSENTVSYETAQELGAYVFPVLSLVFAKVGAALLLGRIRVIASPACIDNNMMGLVVDQKRNNVSFVRYAMHLVKFDLIANPGAVPSLNEGQIGSFILPCPSSAEQTAIATFLDRETAKIDDLIAEQRNLIELLKEKRQALISHAVTKGLDPAAPMKDSGVEWLGEVPAHWRAMALGRVTEAKCDGPFGSGIKSDHYTDFGALVVRLQNIRAAGFFDGEPAYLAMDYFEAELFRHNVVPGDVLIAGLGDDNNLVGRACVAPEGISPALVKADCFRFRLEPGAVHPSFIATQLSVSAAYDAGQMSSGSTRSRIPLTVMATRKVALPPLEEQTAIAAFLDHETSKIDDLMAEAKAATILLQERRTALISAAVTGKIDVRDRKTVQPAPELEVA